MIFKKYKPLINFTIGLYLFLISSLFASEVELSQQEKLFLSQKGVIAMCVSSNFMPYEDIVDGRYVGMMADYMAVVSKNIGIPFKLIPTIDWDETTEKAKQGVCDIIPFIIDTPERRKHFNFTKPYIGEPLVIATLSKTPYVVDVKYILDKPLGIVKGYAYVELLKKQYPDINLVEVESIVEGLKKLNSGELHAYLDGLNVIGYHIQELRLSNLKINGTLKNNYDVSIASGKHMPLLNDILEKGLASVSEKDKLNIKNSWVKITYEHRFDYTLIFQISMVVILIFGFMLYHQGTLKKHNKLLEKLSETDALTRVNNRMKLDALLDNQLSLFERYHEPFSLIMIDIDYFKKFNDKFGHLIGDKVLKHVAQLLKNNCRKADMVGRWGGEEFIIICPNTKLNEGAILAESVRKIVEKSTLTNIDPVTISLGVAEMTAHDNFNTIISRADDALYRVKQNGRNGVDVRPKKAD